METISEFFEKSLKRDLKLKGPELPNEEKVFFETPLGYEDEEELDLFVGRKKNLETLSFSISEAMKGLYNKIIISGESGTGKTSMLHLTAKTIKKVYSDSILFYFGEEIHISNIETIRLLVLSAIVESYVGQRTGHAKEKEALSKLNKNSFKTDLMGMAENTLTVQDVFESEGLCAKGEDPIEKYYALLENKKMIFFIDNSEELLKNRVLFSETMKIMTKVKGLLILSLFSNTLVNLKKENDDIIKNSQIIELEMLSEEDCKELLRRRILFGKDKVDEIKKIPNYAVDLQPFTEEFVSAVASISKRIPLKFIQLLKLAFSCARENKYTIIDNKCLSAMADIHAPIELIELTEKQRKVYEFIREKRVATSNEVKQFMEVKSTVAAFLMLKKLVEKSLIVKKKRGKEAIFSVI